MNRSEKHSAKCTVVVSIRPGLSVEVAEVERTDNPHLKIAAIPAKHFAAGVCAPASSLEPELLWCVVRAGSRRPIIRGLLTRDLALKAVTMLTASGIQLAPGTTIPSETRYRLDLFHAAARAMSDCYLQLA